MGEMQPRSPIAGTPLDAPSQQVLRGARLPNPGPSARRASRVLAENAPTVLVMAPLMMATPAARGALDEPLGRATVPVGSVPKWSPSRKAGQSTLARVDRGRPSVALVFGIVVTGLIAGPAIRQ